MGAERPTPATYAGTRDLCRALTVTRTSPEASGPWGPMRCRGTHAASRALHPRMAEKLIAAFDDQVLVEELSKAGANDLKLRHLQLSVHLESLRNKWQASKSSMVDQSAHRDHEIEALALERKLKAIDHERWRRKNTAIGGSSEDEFEVASHSSEGERKSVASDDSAYAATGEKAARDSVEARVAQQRADRRRALSPRPDADAEVVRADARVQQRLVLASVALVVQQLSLIHI